MTDTTELCCERCGSTSLTHFIGPDRRRRRCWRNRCLDCGRVSEYMPTRLEIQQQCQALRAQHAVLSDEQEKLVRQLQRADDPDDDWDEPLRAA